MDDWVSTPKPPRPTLHRSMKVAMAALWGCRVAGPGWIPVTVTAKRRPGSEGAMASWARVTELSQRETVCCVLIRARRAFCKEGTQAFLENRGCAELESER